MLSRPNRIRKNKEFNYIYKKGKVFGCEYFSVHYVTTHYNIAKFGFSISKKVGNSVVRSKTKRLLSEAVRNILSNVKIYNFIITAKPAIVNASYAELNDVVKRLFKNNHLLNEESNV